MAPAHGPRKAARAPRGEMTGVGGVDGVKRRVQIGSINLKCLKK
ncbi:hypothetical protein CCACVL1_25822 [Corchorus capsularis]|uniref:Uncharacterized protein n=1 Tax=Corchorus capsularis TaxID=210143 RepID=A0A1R3GGV6_COCAP|nr:hypothetical protein CCACVL1_25822 [Corchorus capsularis]